MSNFTLNIELPPYLAQWLIHENDGVQPIVFPRLSIENRVLEIGLIKTPHNARHDAKTDTSIAIAIPCFRTKPPETYHYLPVSGRSELTRTIRSRFNVQFFNDLHKFGYIGKRHDELIEAWMVAHGIELNDTNSNTLLKIYQRMHKNYLERVRYKRKTKKK